MASHPSTTSDMSTSTTAAGAEIASDITAAVEITIEVGAAIVCTPLGGNAHVYLSQPVNAIRWRSDVPFTLRFQTFDDSATVGWPFQQPEPHWPVLQCVGVPQGSAAPLYFKYSVSVPGGLFLDPIVIIDK